MKQKGTSCKNTDEAGQIYLLNVHVFTNIHVGETGCSKRTSVILGKSVGFRAVEIKEAVLNIIEDDAQNNARK